MPPSSPVTILAHAVYCASYRSMAKHSRLEHAESDNDTIYVSASSEYELEDEFEDISIPLTSNDITEDRTGDPPDGALQDVALPSAHEEPVLFTPRSYQIEMFEESLRRNIIVAVSSPLLPKDVI
jgi:hypothetical protein